MELNRVKIKAICEALEYTIANMEMDLDEGYVEADNLDSFVENLNSYKAIYNELMKGE